MRTFSKNYTQTTYESSRWNCDVVKVKDHRGGLSMKKQTSEQKWGTTKKKRKNRRN
jgi:hypothetical protein